MTHSEQSDTVRLIRGEDGMFRDEEGRLFSGAVSQLPGGEWRGRWVNYCPECGREMEDSRS